MLSAIEAPRRPIGPDGITVSAVGLGTMGMGGYFAADYTRDNEYIALIHAALDLGIDLFDTAEIYSAGHAEEILGAALQGRRDQVFLASKFSPENAARASVIAAAEGSLRRLRTDVIDLYQLHWPNPAIPFEETLEALDSLWSSGKIRYVGLSNCALQDVERAGRLLSAPLVALQNEYSLLERGIEAALLPFCRTQKVKMLSYSPLAQGKLATSAHPVLTEIASAAGTTVAAVALAWLVREEVIPIPKAGTLDHLRQNARAAQLRIADSDMERLAEAFTPSIEDLRPSEIEPGHDPQRVCYQTLAEALANEGNMIPSPQELAAELLAGRITKPIKVRRNPAAEPPFTLVEGRLRYWAWVIAFGYDKPIRALIES